MIFITGASGFIGRSVLTRLQNETDGVTVYNGRINNPLTIRQQLQPGDTVIHLAGCERRGRPQLLQHVDIDGTTRLLEECQRAGISRFIFLSRLGADPYSSYPLLRVKGEIERMVVRSGLPYTLVRSATVFGQDDYFTNHIARLAYWSWPFLWLPGGGEVRLQPIWVEDLARALVLAARQPRFSQQTLLVAGEEPLKYREVAQMIVQIAGMRRYPISIPPLLIRPLLPFTLTWRRYPLVTPFFLARFATPEATDIDVMVRQFGFRPMRMEEQIAYLRGV